MGLYINTSEHPGMFKNNNKLHEPNQGYLKIDYFTELANEQKKINEIMIKRFKDMEQLYMQHANYNESNWQSMDYKLSDIQEKYADQEQFQHAVKDWFISFDKSNRKLEQMIQNDSVQKQEIYDQLTQISQVNEQILGKIDLFDLFKKDVSTQLNDLYQINNDMSDSLSSQDKKHSEIVNRLENQEALTEKVIRQMDYIRSIIFERASYLADKVEENYQLTSSYVYKLLTGGDEQITLYYNEPQKVRNHNRSE